MADVTVTTEVCAPKPHNDEQRESMPSAKANIRAKFIAQIEIGVTLVKRSSKPAALKRPAIVSNKGSPAATSEPKASTKMASVTGHENNSDLIMAVRLAVLKSDHSTDAPVAVTVIPCEPSAARGAFKASAARTIVLGSEPAPPSTTAVLSFALMEMPATGRTTALMSGFDLNIFSTERMVATPRGLESGELELTTTSIAELACPPKSF